MKPFASTADTEAKEQRIEVLGDGIYALTAGGDPNIGAIEGEDFLVCFESLATPVAAERWLKMLREHTDKPIKYLVLSHYHAVRVLGASAFNADIVVAHETTAALIEERGQEDWLSEYGRMPRLFDDPESIPGLTRPNLTFADKAVIDLGGSRGQLVLEHVGRGHTEGDIIAWLPQQGVLFAGDLVESQAALYTGDAFHREWATTTLDRIAAFGATTLVGGRGEIARGTQECQNAIALTRMFLTTMLEEVGGVQQRGGSLKEAFEATHAALNDDFGHWPIFEHCLPFDVSRVWDELSGIERPRIWTAERDREVWALLQS